MRERRELHGHPWQELYARWPIISSCVSRRASIAASANLSKVDLGCVGDDLGCVDLIDLLRVGTSETACSESRASLLGVEI